MSRQHANRSYFPSRPYVPLENSSRRFRSSTQNDHSNYQYPSQRSTNESSRIINNHSAIPLNRITSTATSAAFTPYYHFENPSAASFTRHPPWFDYDVEDHDETTSRSSHRNHHSKRQRRPSTNTTFNSQAQYPHRYHERKRSRRYDENEHEQNNHQYQSHTNQRSRQVQQTNSTGRNIPSLPRSFHDGSYSHPFEHRPYHYQPLSANINHRQPIHSSNANHHRTGMAFESTSQRPPHFHRTSMTTHHMHPRTPPSFLLTNLLHRVVHAHAGSYSDNYVHYIHPPSASIDLIAYAWMSPSHDLFSLPTTFSVQFGDFFDLVLPDETPVVGLTDTEIERLPTIVYKKPDTNIKVDDKCAICLSEYTIGEKLKRLRCKHYFHNECINPWLKTSTRCPICRGEQTS